MLIIINPWKLRGFSEIVIDLKKARDYAFFTSKNTTKDDRFFAYFFANSFSFGENENHTMAISTSANYCFDIHVQRPK